MIEFSLIAIVLSSLGEPVPVELGRNLTGTECIFWMETRPSVSWIGNTPIRIDPDTLTCGFTK